MLRLCAAGRRGEGGGGGGVKWSGQGLKTNKKVICMFHRVKGQKKSPAQGEGRKENVGRGSSEKRGGFIMKTLGVKPSIRPHAA